MLYEDGLNDQFFYIILFGKLRLYQKGKARHYGQTLNIGWTIGEEILFRGENTQGKISRSDTCRAVTEAGVLGI